MTRIHYLHTATIYVMYHVLYDSPKNFPRVVLVTRQCCVLTILTCDITTTGCMDVLPSGFSKKRRRVSQAEVIVGADTMVLQGHTEEQDVNVCDADSANGDTDGRAIHEIMDHEYTKFIDRAVRIPRKLLRTGAPSFASRIHFGGLQWTSARTRHPGPTPQ